MKKLLPFLTLLAMLFIFSNSLSNGEEATAKRGFVISLLTFLARVFTGKEISFGPAELTVVSKLFHVAEFFLFSFLLSFSIYLKRGTLEKTFQQVLLCGVLTALADEQLQMLSKGRGSTLSDVFVDTAGVLIAFGIAFVITKLFEKKEKA